MVFSLKVNNILTLFLKLNLHVIFVIFFFYYFSPLDYTIARRGNWLWLSAEVLVEIRAPVPDCAQIVCLWSCPSLCFKMRLSAKPLICQWKWYFILMQMVHFHTKDLHFSLVLESKSFWNWEVAYRAWINKNDLSIGQ